MANETSNKIVVIGAGNVGETICYTLMLRAQVGEIVLVDLNEDRAKGAALDISHGTAFYSQVRVRQGGYEECADAKIIIVTAGVPRKPGQTRLELAKVNTGVARSIAKNIMKYAKNPLIIVVSNPVDVNTYLIQKETGIESRVSVLGYIQRGGQPTAKDRMYGSLMGAYAIEILRQGRGNRIVAIKNDILVDYDIAEAIDLHNNNLDSFQYQLSLMLAE